MSTVSTSTTNSMTMTQKQRVTRTPLTSIDTNKNVGSRAIKDSRSPTKKWFQSSFNRKIMKKPNEIPNKNQQRTEYNESDHSSHHGISSTKEENNFWTEEMEELLTLRIANPIYDSEDEDEMTENASIDKSLLDQEEDLTSGFTKLDIHND